VSRAPPSDTLHARIRSSIERRILSGAWKPGDRIPFEHELMEKHQCSRMTVSKAIADLVSAGLVVRRRRAGSFVAPPPVHLSILDIPDIQAEIRQRGQDYSYKLLARAVRKPARGNADEQALADDGSLLAVECLHSANKRPFALERRLIALKAVPSAADADFAHMSPGAWLLDHVPWTQAEHRVSAVSADAAMSDALEIDPRAACLRLERRTWRNGVAITHVVQTFAGESYHLAGSFMPTRAKRR
jgi:GntR family histidine utilization transcriptional repressor